ncbi:MAG: LamG domain-containing protein [Candidatus Diapherotrites archaeon]|uniref:LamG domain-containing protein n=1 Tax=Candidatus Iainarchaeum sp. TaxID=3101447 RepID=A0A8T4L8F3_9ARCH|nr:LamG domain-containing protein [Candidatus Diapherotrites archaeon]
MSSKQKKLHQKTPASAFLRIGLAGLLVVVLLAFSTTALLSPLSSGALLGETENAFLDGFDSDVFLEKMTNTAVADGKIRPVFSFSPVEIASSSSLGNGLIGLWHLNGSLADASPEKRSLARKASTRCFVTGILSKACRLDGSRDYLDAGDFSDLEGIRSFSISMWVKNDGTKELQYLAQKNWGSGDTFALQRTTDGSAAFSIYSSTGKPFSAMYSHGLADTKWHLVTGVFDGSKASDNVVIFVDGVKGNQTANFRQKTSASTSRLGIGGRNDAASWDGLIDEIAVWDRAITDAEIKSLLGSPPLVMSFESKSISTQESFSSLTPRWSEVDHQCAVEVSTDNGASWCSVENGVAILDLNCLLPADSFKYRIRFLSVHELDWVRFDWNVVSPPVETPVCGNNKLETGEICDGTDIGSVSCSTLGLGVGAVSCNPDCSGFDSSSCREVPDDLDPTGEWKPPIGIPLPSFGIFESHVMYAGQEGYSDAGNGPYTYLVDNSSSACTDSSNRGSPQKPRCTIPSSLSAGDVVEIRGGPYSYDDRWLFTLNGSKQKPVFFRGENSSKKPVIIGKQVRFDGKFGIVENVVFDNSNILFYGDGFDHWSIRFNEFKNYRPATGAGKVINLKENASDMVVYKNSIHDNGDVLSDVETDVHGFTVYSGSKNIWVVDNAFFNNAGDAVQFCHHCPEPVPHHVYIGRNVFHDDRENAIDIKESRDVVISENKMYGYVPASASDGSAIIVHYGPERVWMLFNEIFDSSNGIRIDGAKSAFAIGNVIHDIHHYYSNGYDPSEIWQPGNGIWVRDVPVFSAVGNTLFSVDAGIASPGNSSQKHFFTNNIVSNLTEPSHHLGVEYTAVSSQSKAENNLFFQPGSSATVKWGSDSVVYSVSSFDSKFGMNDNVDQNPLFVNVPVSCQAVPLREIVGANGSVSEVLVDDQKRTQFSSTTDFEAAGVVSGARLMVKSFDDAGLDCGEAGRDCRFLTVASVNGNKLVLDRLVNSSSVSGIEFLLSFYPFTATEVYVLSSSGYAMGDIVEIGNDGVKRIVESVSSDAIGKKIILTDATKVSSGIVAPTSMCNWKNNSNIARDFGLAQGSPAVDAGALDSVYGLYTSLYNVDITNDVAGTTRPKGNDWDIGAMEQ